MPNVMPNTLAKSWKKQSNSQKRNQLHRVPRSFYLTGVLFFGGAGICTLRINVNPLSLPVVVDSVP